MEWWSWCILGVVLLGIELFAVDAQFYLVFAGLAAIIVGLLGLVGIDLPLWAQWLSFAVLALATMFTRAQADLRPAHEQADARQDQHRRRPTHRRDARAPPGKSCRIEYRGSGWTAINVGERPIAAGAAARIDSIDGLTLHVRAL